MKSKINLYHRKQRWKIALLGFAVIMVVASLWFSSNIVNKVQAKEIDRINQWADAVQRKSNLVKLTNKTFDELSEALIALQEKERLKVEMWSRALKEINKTHYDYSFFVQIIRETNNIPMILADMNETNLSPRNLEHVKEKIKQSLDQPNDSLVEVQFQDSLKAYIQFWKTIHEPIIIDLYDNEKQQIFYFDSTYFKAQKLVALQQSRDSLIDAFTNELITNEYLVPVLFIDQNSRTVLATNMKDYDSLNASNFVRDVMTKNDSILVDLGRESQGVVYFESSEEVTQMRYFPIIQFLLIGLFVLIAYVAFSTFRKAEQDQVWAGMAKETAHQLGTPISSLLAWNELLDSQGVDQSITSEINKDLDRLQIVTDRFSKIGSESLLKEENIVGMVNEAVGYLKARVSNKVEIQIQQEKEIINAMINKALMEWVIENIVKNAVDAMESQGEIIIKIGQEEDQVIIDISDNGKGIPPGKLKAVFQPGFTTKKRGWGLGLSLVKRIVEEFHKGKVFVLKSEPEVGTTFRIKLNV